MGIPIKRITESTKLKESETNNYSAVLDQTIKTFQVGDELVIVPNQFTKEDVVTILAQDLADTDQISLDEATDIVERQVKEFGSSPKVIRRNGSTSSVITESMEEEMTLQGYVDDDSNRILLFPGNMSNDDVVQELVDYLREEGEAEEDLESEANRLTDTYYDVYQYEK